MLSRCKDETIEVAGWSTVPLPLSWLMDDHNDITVRVACATNHAWSQPLFRPRGKQVPTSNSKLDSILKLVTSSPL